MTPLKTVTSTNVHSIGYDPATQSLAIRFKTKDGEGASKVYTHQGVPPEHGNGITSAESVGGYYATHIRGKYPHESADA